MCTGQEVDARADVLLGQRALVGVAVGAGSLRIDPDDVQVERVPVARVARERLDARQLGHRRVVGGDVAAADLGVLSILSSWQSAIAARTSERFALKPATRTS